MPVEVVDNKVQISVDLFIKDKIKSATVSTSNSYELAIVQNELNKSEENIDLFTDVVIIESAAIAILLVFSIIGWLK